jgi:hypothetical protein
MFKAPLFYKHFDIADPEIIVQKRLSRCLEYGVEGGVYLAE